MKKTIKKDISNLLFEQSEWNFDTINETFEALKTIADEELGLSYYPIQVEVITAEQMLDCYSSVGMPLMYNHWSFGKRFIQDSQNYQKGRSGLAYEIVINSSPSICYIMEENTMTMQALVMAHAAFGHNHFFYNNHLFKQWTNADMILDYLHFAKKYIQKCEDLYGIEEVALTIDAAHALQNKSVHQYQRDAKDLKSETEKLQARQAHAEANFNPIWSTLPQKASNDAKPSSPEDGHYIAQDPLAGLNLPHENILYFLEKHSPVLPEWKREILRIVRNMAQYFYPQQQTQLMNEGCACYCHYYLMNRLFDKGLINEGSILEFLTSHAGVVMQPEFDSPYYSGLNPYKMGFSMMMDIERICNQPTEEDLAWFPDFAGNKKPIETLKDAWINYRDESFVLQFLSPHLIRELKLFALTDDQKKDHILIEAIHDEQGYKKIRAQLAEQYAVSSRDVSIQVIGVDIAGDRKLTLSHMMHEDIKLHDKSAAMVTKYIEFLWGYEVEIITE